MKSTEKCSFLLHQKIYLLWRQNIIIQSIIFYFYISTHSDTSYLEGHKLVVRFRRPGVNLH